MCFFVFVGPRAEKLAAVIGFSFSPVWRIVMSEEEGGDMRGNRV